MARVAVLLVAATLAGGAGAKPGKNAARMEIVDPAMFEILPDDGERACALSGTVKAAGKPLSGVAVILRRQEEYTTVAQASVVTDAKGRYSFAAVRPSWYRISVHVDGRMPFTRAWKCENGAPGDKDLELQQGDATITGQVTDESGVPLLGTEVTVQEIGSKERFRVATFVNVDDEGRFRLQVTGGASTYRLYALAPGYGFLSRDLVVKPGATESASFKLPREGFVEGVVTKSDGSPAKGAQIFQEGKGLLVGTFADDKGRFGMEVRPGYALSVIARIDGEIGAVPLLPLSKGETRGGLAIKLTKGRTIRALVVDEGGKPQPRIEVLLGTWPPGMYATAITDAEGRATIDGMPGKRLRLMERRGPARAYVGEGVDHVTLVVAR